MLSDCKQLLFVFLHIHQAVSGVTLLRIKDIQETFQNIVNRDGAIDLEGRLQQTSRVLDIARNGRQIRERLESAINDLLQVGHLRWIGDRITFGSDEST